MEEKTEKKAMLENDEWSKKFNIPKGIDSLAKLFLMQENLNDLIFYNHKITDREGNLLKCSKFREEEINHEIANTELDANTLIAKWTTKFLHCSIDEANEAIGEIPQKYWSCKTMDRVKLIEEIIDVWHFLISASISVGLDYDTLMTAYTKKYNINISRQFNHYIGRENMNDSKSN